MQLANPICRRDAFTRQRVKATARPTGSPEAIAEINAYIAVRDQLVAEAETLRTKSTIESATSANEFVAQAVQPARTAYAAQSLNEIDAARERQRCELVRQRIARLLMLAAA